MLRLRNYTDLVLFKVYADLKSDTERNYLGWLWWVLEPIVQIAIYYVVFGIFMASPIKNFFDFLLVGVVMWRWFSVSLTNSTVSIARHNHLLTQTHVPKLLFPLTALATDVVLFFIFYLVVITFLLSGGHGVTMAWLMLPAVLLVQFIFTLGCALICAGVMPFAPDIRIVVENALRAGFFLSGVFFSTSNLPLYLQEYMYLNPMAILLDVQRAILISGEMTNFKGLLYALSVGMVLTTFGVLLIRRNEHVYPKVT